MKKTNFEKINIFIALTLVICMSKNNLLTFGFSNWNTSDPVTDAYKDGEPDYMAGDVIATGNKVYYRHKDGTFHKCWLKAGKKWYYFDLADSALVTNALKDIDDKVYYFNNFGQMASNIILEIASYKIQVDSNGACRMIN